MLTDSSQNLLPFSHLNLRRNPFGEFTQTERIDVAVVDIQAFTRHLQEPNCVVQLVGEKGYGKTTHLLSLRSEFGTSGYVHIAEGTRGQIPSGSPIMIDEAQRLTFRQRWKLFRQHVPLVLGTHRDFCIELRAAGRRVVTVHVQEATSVDRVHCLLNARIEHVRRGSGAIPQVTRETSAALLEKHGPNIRSILHELFEVTQKMSSISNL